MASPGAPHALVTVAIIALIVWRLYSRIRRTLGRQRLSPVRPWLAAGSLACGAAVGIGLGVLGLRLTRFEVSAEGRYYTPSAHLGVALSTLLVCRIAYRFLVNGLPGAGASAPPPAMALGPLTLLLV
ncbi:MAG: hypothetical protein ACRETP_07750, partial [Steroidobacteraceae bacterium]